MAPVQVYTGAPIRPKHPTGITPQTAEPNDASSTYTPGSVTATAASTTAPVSRPVPPPPKPGARPTPTAPVRQASGPSPPQPGATPVVTEHHTTTFTTQAQFPQQWSIPPPAQSNLQTRSTMTNIQTQSSHARSQSLFQQPPDPTFLPYNTADARRLSLQHPPNYTQNQYYNDAAADRERGESSGESDWWKVAKGWVEGAGEKLADAEKEVWRWAKGR